MADLLHNMAASLDVKSLCELYENDSAAKRIPSSLMDIPVGRYPLADWVQAVRYILRDDTLTPCSEWEARALLCGKRQKRHSI